MGALATTAGVDLFHQLEAWGADVSLRRRARTDIVLVGVDTTRGLSARLRTLEASLRRDGAIWIAYPRGRPDLRETDVIQQGLDAGFVDNKVVRFSATHTALRFVIPKARR
jgi:hypothetical protein